VRLAFYTVLVLLATAVDHACLTRWPAAPDLTLAFAAWAMVDGDEDGVVWRALIAGLVRELVDPVATGFHLGSMLALAVVFLPLRRFFFRARGTAWAVWAGLAYLFVRGVDGVLTGFGDYQPAVLVVGTLGTALVAVACGWLFGGLPASIRPVPLSGA
jgi:hypothetical protein